jgi:hypothetical protein
MMTTKEIEKLTAACDRKIKDAVFGGGTWQFLSCVLNALQYLQTLHALPGTCSEENDLAHGIAEEAARGLIESISVEEEIDGREWIDINHVALDVETVAEACEDDIRYLELRGLLEHHPTRPNLIRLVEEQS